MKKIIFICLFLSFPCVAFSAHGNGLSEELVNPGFYEKPDWFKQSFLDLQDDLDDANENNKRIILYFHQDGCPYCKKLLDDNFSNKNIVEKMKQHYDLLEINMWGDKSITSISGAVLSEKEFAKQMKVMFTPTLVVLDREGLPLFRMNGYYAPDKFLTVLDYLSPDKKLNEKWPDFTEYLSQKKQTVSHGLHTEKFIRQDKDLHKLIKSSRKPVMILFEQADCAECNELHGDLFRRLPVYKKLKQFTIAQIDINSTQEIIAPNGETMTSKTLAKTLKIQYTPSILFFEIKDYGTKSNKTNSSSDGGAVFRSEAYLKGFHLQALLDYISTGAYQTEPEFQRFVQRRADKMREEGVEVDLWE